MAGSDPLKNNRAALFWTLHIAGWLGYGVAQYVGSLVYPSMKDKLATTSPSS